MTKELSDLQDSPVLEAGIELARAAVTAAMVEDEDLVSALIDTHDLDETRAAFTYLLGVITYLVSLETWSDVMLNLRLVEEGVIA